MVVFIGVRYAKYDDGSLLKVPIYLQSIVGLEVVFPPIRVPE